MVSWGAFSLMGAQSRRLVVDDGLSFRREFSLIEGVVRTARAVHGACGLMGWCFGLMGCLRFNGSPEQVASR